MLMYRQDSRLGLLQLNVSTESRPGAPQKPSSLATASLSPLGSRPTVSPNSMHCTTGSRSKKHTILEKVDTSQTTPNHNPLCPFFRVH